MASPFNFCRSCSPAKAPRPATSQANVEVVRYLAQVTTWARDMDEVYKLDPTLWPSASVMMSELSTRLEKWMSAVAYADMKKFL